MENERKQVIIRGLSGETEAERQEIRSRQFAIRESWDSETEFRRRVVKNDLGVVAQDINWRGCWGFDDPETRWMTKVFLGRLSLRSNRVL